MTDAIATIMKEGGLTLWALLLLAVMAYSLTASVWVRCIKVRKKVASQSWQTASGNSNRKIERHFAAFELDEMAWIERRIPFLGVLIGAAPLLGLLGTVSGMLVTFSGMSSQGSRAPIDTISTGISQALITTQAGLVIAIPAAFFLAMIKRENERTQLQLEKQLHQKLGGLTT
ncbi:MAG: biopolymer transport protein ExbB [Akkermansiaceae bacterium]|jgi:biopolymer transport protein ExbB